MSPNGLLSEMLEKACRNGTSYQLLFTDIQIPFMDDYSLTKTIRKPKKPIAIVALTAHASNSDKPVAPTTFVAAVRNTISVEQVGRSAFEELDRFRKKFDLLLSRELQVADLVLEGNETKQIAKSLGIIVKTVEVHRGRITKKLEITSVARLVKLFLDAKHSSAPNVFEDRSIQATNHLQLKIRQ
jgi:FixJ family two-component response regulator